VDTVEYMVIAHKATQRRSFADWGLLADVTLQRLRRVEAQSVQGIDTWTFGMYSIRNDSKKAIAALSSGVRSGHLRRRMVTQSAGG
jgi:hypothetical protein